MRFLGIFFTIIIFSLIPFTAQAREETSARQALIIDNETGQILLEKNKKQHMPTSSMSKVMTSYMIFDALKNGILKIDDELLVSEKAWQKGGSKMFVEVGKKIKVEDLLKGVIIQSGNDATIVLAEGLSGSEEKFAEDMTKKAHKMGMENSNFMNASGWPDPNHYSSAEDLVLLARMMIENHPEYYKLFAEKEFTYNEITQPNRNPLLYQNIGADGMKTGHTEAGGYGLIGTAVKDGRRVIMVLNGLESEEARATESLRLMHWALNNFTNVTLAKAGDIITDVEVAMGQKKTVPLTLTEDIQITMPKAAVNNYTVDITYKKPLIAPVLAKQQVAEMVINAEGLDPISYPLVTAEPVEKLGIFKTTIEKMKNFYRQMR